jgi:hypothetical protein
MALLVPKLIRTFLSRISGPCDPPQGADVEAFLQKNQQFAEHYGLGEEVVRAALHSLHGERDVRYAGNDHDGRIGARGSYFTDKVDPFSVGKGLVDDHRIKGPNCKLGPRFREGPHCMPVKTRSREESHQNLANYIFIVNNQNTLFHV